jgi:iron complex outermembrane receptor protein
VQVQGQAETAYGPGVGYVARLSAVGTKSDTPLIETPQAISVVTRQQMDDQNPQSVAQALRYTSGIVAEQRGANTDSLEYLYTRGFQIDEYLNGLRLPGPSIAGYNITSFDPYMLDRIEVLHGPASVLYGQSSPGGILNIDSKRPTDDPLHEIMLQTGSYGRVQGGLDLGGKLTDDGTLLGRLTADAFSTGTQVDHVNEKRISLAPSLTWRPDADTSLTIFANYQYDPNAGFYNFLPAAGTVLPGTPISRSYNPGDPSFESYSKTELSIGYSFKHNFDDVWSVSQDFRYLYNKQTIYTVEPNTVTADGNSLTRSAYINNGIANSATLDNRAQARVSTGPLDHTLTFGVDLQRIEYDHSLLFGNAPNISLINPPYSEVIPTPTTLLGTSAYQTLDQLGVYGQDQVRLGRFALLFGVREDFADGRTETMSSHAVTTQYDRAFTWRSGLVYLFDNGLAPYFSYATSFQPTVGTSFSGAAFQPTTGQQYEAGLKYQPPGSNSFITGSLFNLTEQNVLTTDPAHANFQVQTGEIRSRGVELEAHATLTDNLQLIASYTYTDLLNTKSNPSSLDKVPVAIPANMAAGWLTFDTPWRWSEGLQLGGGVRYLGSSYGDAVNSFKVPSATLVDMAVHYDLGAAVPQAKGMSLSVTASNLLDKDYVICTSDVGCVYGAGRLVLANLKYKW